MKKDDGINSADENKQQNIAAEPLFKTYKNYTFIH
jgi:hypothetical protein